MKKVIIGMIILMTVTGCNKQLIDLEYEYDKAVCYYGNEKKELEIKKWKDYDGEQIQIIDKEGKTYLVSSYNCMLIKEK